MGRQALQSTIMSLNYITELKLPMHFSTFLVVSTHLRLKIIISYSSYIPAYYVEVSDLYFTTDLKKHWYISNKFYAYSDVIIPSARKLFDL
jgi:hypothetical protein